jgi:hypothetical protein
MLKKMIKKIFSALFPAQIKQWLKKLHYYNQLRQTPHNHKKALDRIRKKEKIKIAFFILKSSVWKFEILYRLLENDKKFEPVIIICPYNTYGRETMLRHMNQAFEYFNTNGYNVIKSLDETTGKWLNVKKEIKPDIVFFSVHWNLTRPEYKIQTYNRILTCYSTYTFVISHLYQGYFNQEMHNLVWKYFVETTAHQKIAQKYAQNKGTNVVVSGYPGMDILLQKDYQPVNVWKINDKKIKRIIWSPHHTIQEFGATLDYSTFLNYCDFMFDLANKYRDQIQIAFKPHPILRSKLSLDAVWGKEKTEKYFQKWANLPNGQLNEGEYFDLFATSDGLINDSSAFVIEYLYTGKPMMFLKNDDSVGERMNEIGRKALTKLYIGKHKEDVERFITEVILENNDPMKNDRNQFFNNTIKPPNNVLASQNIYNHIKSEIFTH